MAKKAEEFDTFLKEAVCGEEANSKRAAVLAKWKQASSAVFCHPREEHLIPLMVCAGAAREDDKGVCFYENQSMGIKTSSFKFS